MAHTALCLGTSSVPSPTAWGQVGLRCPALELATQGCPASLVSHTSVRGGRLSLDVCAHGIRTRGPQGLAQVPKVMPRSPGRVLKC